MVDIFFFLIPSFLTKYWYCKEKFIFDQSSVWNDEGCYFINEKSSIYLKIFQSVLFDHILSIHEERILLHKIHT